MALWTDVIDPATLTGYARASLEEYEQRKGSLASFLPNEQVEDINVRLNVGNGGLVAMSVLTFVSMAGALNSSIMSAPRVYYAMAQDGKFPPIMGSVHPSFRTPHVALFVQGLWSVGLLALWGKFSTITDNVVFIFWIFYALGAGAVLRMRALEPHTHRPYRAVGYPWIPYVFIFAAVCLTANTLHQAFAASAQALVLVITGAILYPLFKSPPMESNNEAEN